MTGLPEWVTDLPGFDPTQWWLPIVCTGRDTHPVELLGVVFEHAETHRLHFAGRGFRHEVYAEGPPVTLRGTWGTSTSVRPLPGSLNVPCPTCPCSPRIPRARWSQLLTATRHSDLPMLDVSGW